MNGYKKEYKYMAISKSVLSRPKREAEDIQLQHLWKNVTSFVVWQNDHRWSLSTVLSSKLAWRKSSFCNLYYAALDLLLVEFSGSWAEKIKPVQQRMVMHIHVLRNNLMLLQTWGLLLWWYTVTHFKNVIYYKGVRRGGGCAMFSDRAWA